MALLYVRGVGSDVEIADLGITVAQGPGWTLLASSDPAEAEGSAGQFTARETRDSKDLYDAISGGSLQWSKNGSDVAPTADYVADFMLMQDFTDDFLDLSGGRLRLPQTTDVPGTLTSGIEEGEIAWDTDDDSLYVFNGSSWVTAGTVIDHGDLNGLDDDDHDQYLLLSGDETRNIVDGAVDFSTASGLILPTGTDRTGLLTVEGNIMWDTDDDILWLYDGTQWVDLPTTLSGVLDHGTLVGLDDDDHLHYLTEARHDALPADNPHSVTFTQAVTADAGTDISAAEAETLTDGSNADLLHVHDYAATVHTHDHGLDLTGLLDDDHPQYGHLAQDETVSGMWTFDPTTATDPSIVLAPRAAAPSTNLADGALAHVDGILYTYDATRSKWLSVDRVKWVAGRNANATNIFLRGPDGIAQSTTGYRIPRDGTITALWAQTRVAESWTLEIRRSGAVIASLAIAAADGGQDTTINVDVSAGDELSMRCNGTNIGRPVGSFEVAWRV